jgi:hypothetical protein
MISDTFILLPPLLFLFFALRDEINMGFELLLASDS